jgi:hypothetical protein
MRKHGMTTKTAAAVALTLTAIVAPFALGDWQQVFTLSADDEGRDDWFGWGLAVSGNLAVIGAPGNDGPRRGDRVGTGYVFDMTTGDQLRKFFADDGEEGDYFAGHVAISGDLVIVSATGDDHVYPENPSCNAGSAYLFDINTGEQLHKLTAIDADCDDYFGRSVAIRGSIAAVGATSYSGRAYLFDVNTGQQVYELLPDDNQAGQAFGISVALNSEVVLVGAAYDSDVGHNAGSVYVFDVDTGKKIRIMYAEDAQPDDHFGSYVAIHGNIAVIGAPDVDDAAEDAGAAYVFDVTTGQQLRELVVDDGEPFDHFGYAVALDGNIAAIGASDEDDADEDAGAVYIFDITTGEQLQKLVADDGGWRDGFGEATSISGDIILVGAHNHDGGAQDSGAAYVFVGDPPCPADFDGDGFVNTADLLFLLGAWGTPDGDVDFDGDTDTADLLALLAAWGECPE